MSTHRPARSQSVAPLVGTEGPTRRAHREDLADLYQELARRIASRDLPLLAWSKAFRLEGGEPLDFARFPYQPEIYRAFGDATLPTVEVMKSAQCGVSAAAVSLALYACDAWGANVLYVLPGFADAHDFSDTRVKPAVADSPYLRWRVASTDNKGLKRIGEANLYLRGSGSERQALSIPADVLILDEYDRLDQRNVPKFRRRLGAPTSMGLERRFSNPSFPETGIHRLYLDSDQRQWLVRCRRCRHEAALAYDAGGGAHHVEEERAARVCGKCDRLLAPEVIGAGRWVPRRPGRDRRGYHVSKLIVPSEDIAALVAEHAKADEYSIGAHWNFDLGLPYSPKGGSLSRELVLACRRRYRCPPEYGGRDWVSAGVDVGKFLHVRISRWPQSSGKAIPLFIGEVPGFEELAQLWERYGVSFGLIDERPEERAARAFMGQFPGRCRLVRWSGQAQREDFVQDDDRGLVIARRSWAFDQTVHAFLRQVRLLPAHVTEAYLDQLSAPHRVVETTKEGQKVARYVSERADDFFLAETYDHLAHSVRSGVAAGGWSDPPPGPRDRSLFARGW